MPGIWYFLWSKSAYLIPIYLPKLRMYVVIQVSNKIHNKDEIHSRVIHVDCSSLSVQSKFYGGGGGGGQGW